MVDLTGKVAVITGAKGGLGNYVTRAFLDAGATVAGVSRSISVSDFEHPHFEAFPAELSSLQAAQSVFTQVVSKFDRVDAALHLVGAWAGGGLVESADEASFDRMLDLNLKPAFFVMSAAAALMRPQRSGRLLAIASKTAVDPAPGTGAYSASKAGVVSLMRTLALEFRGTNVTANVVLPGTMDTPQNRAAMPHADPTQWVHPSHVADLLVYLASDSAASVSGAALPVYGADL